ncbi:MAG: MFS transporter [Pseudomonadota bacterium]
MTSHIDSTTPPEKNWRRAALLLMVMAAVMQFAFAAWWTLIKNFAVDEGGLTGFEVGVQETIREIPGFLSFLVIYLILFMREQTIALVSLMILGIGVALTGYFPSIIGIYITTLIMSVGFHYYETAAQSLQLQWLLKAEAPAILGKIVAVASGSQLAAYGLVYVLWRTFDIGFQSVFLIAGAVTLLCAIILWVTQPRFTLGAPQRKSIVLRKRYGLYYALVFIGGARRQIFTVFAGLLMVEKFDYEVHDIALLFLVNGVVAMVLAPYVGRLIGQWGERKALILEYIGLIGVFTAYAFVENATAAGVLYILDHAFFALAIAMKTYFQKIADPSDIAPSAGVSFTINHIAAIFIPVIFGAVWLFSPAAVFLAGAAMACGSLILAFMVPHVPRPGVEFAYKERRPAAAAE